MLETKTKQSPNWRTIHANARRSYKTPVLITAKAGNWVFNKQFCSLSFSRLSCIFYGSSYWCHFVNSKGILGSVSAVVGCAARQEIKKGSDSRFSTSPLISLVCEDRRAHTSISRLRFRLLLLLFSTFQMLNACLKFKVLKGIMKIHTSNALLTEIKSHFGINVRVKLHKMFRWRMND